MKKLFILWWVVFFATAISVHYTTQYLVSPLWVVNIIAGYFLVQYRKHTQYFAFNLIFSFSAIYIASLFVEEFKDVVLQAILCGLCVAQILIFIYSYYFIFHRFKNNKYYKTLILTLPSIISSFFAGFIFMLLIDQGENYFELTDYFLEQFATSLSCVCLFYGFRSWRSIAWQDYILLIIVLAFQYFISTDVIFYACFILPFLMCYYALKYQLQQFAWLVGLMTLCCAMYVALPLAGEFWAATDVHVLSRVSAYRIALGTYLIIFLFVCEIRLNNQRLSRIFQRVMFNDELTGLKNRRFIREKVLKKRGCDYGFILLIDIDNFKRVNDQYGHHIGDLVLQHISKILLKIQNDGNIVVRWGGEEFLIVATHGSVSEAHEMCQKILNYCHELPFKYQDIVLNISVSIGVSVFKNIHENNYSGFVQTADRALYHAKAKGKDTYVFEMA